MRRTALLALLPLVVGFAPAPASTASSILIQDGPGVGGFMSDNVTYVGTIPLDSPGVGGRMLKVGDQMRFYVTGVKGLTIYDVTDPALPKPLGFFPFYHAQNEDVDVSDDGKRVVIGADGAVLVGLPGAKVGIHVIDTTDPANPVLLGSHSDSNHTATCADPKCEWIYGSNGVIYDARNPASIQRLNRWKPNNGNAHALNRDESGLMVSDSNPRFVLDPRVDPANPIVVTDGSRTNSKDDSLQHNNVRPNALDWVPRDPEAADYADPNLRPGELLIGNSESNLNNNCGNLAGGLSTWSMIDFEKGEKIKQLHSFLPKVGDYSDGSPPANALGCSGHWFTYRDGFVAAAWYEHGLRFFKINEQTGAISQVGFFNPVATEAGAAHWVADAAGTEYVYTVDYARGIDIVKFCRTCPVPTTAASNESWEISAGRVGSFAALERYACQAAVRGYKVR